MHELRIELNPEVINLKACWFLLAVCNESGIWTIQTSGLAGLNGLQAPWVSNQLILKSSHLSSVSSADVLSLQVQYDVQISVKHSTNNVPATQYVL